MRLEAKKYLLDIQASADLIDSFTVGRDFNSYASDAMLRSAVERQFGIIGEALRRLHETAPEVVAAIPEYGRIVAFRNVLIHGYAVVDSRLVWGMVEGKLPELAAQVKALLSKQ
jgi:uncharacterized protein with HEPN domain